MKKTVLGSVLSIMILHAVPGMGQCPSNKGQLDISLSYGMIASDQATAQFSTTGNQDGQQKVTYNSGALFASARYFMFNRLAIGFGGGILNERGQTNDRTNPTFIVSSYRQSLTSVCMELYYIYSFRKYVEIYTLLGIAPSFISTETTAYTTLGATTGIMTTVREDRLKAQYSPIGFRFGGKFGGFAELGIGYKGVVTCGLSYKFGRPCWWRYR